MSHPPRPVLYLTLGFPGSGKTHFAVRFAKERDIFHLNADRLRLEMFDNPTYTSDEHRIVFRIMDYIAEELLAKGISVIYDANMNRKIHRDQKRRIAEKCHAETVLFWFKVPLDVALGRISNRGDGEDKYFRSITPEVLHRLKDEIEKPIDEPFIKIDGAKSYEELARSVKLARLSSSSHFDPMYNRQIGVVQGLVDFHPEFLEALDDKSKAVMKHYFFAGKEINVDDVFLYRDTLLKKEPEIKAQANAALRIFLDNAGVSREDQADLFEE